MRSDPRRIVREDWASYIRIFLTSMRRAGQKLQQSGSTQTETDRLTKKSVAETAHSLEAQAAPTCDIDELCVVVSIAQRLLAPARVCAAWAGGGVGGAR